MTRRQLVSGFVAILGFWAVGCVQPAAEAPQELTNSIGMKLVLVPRGMFTMGSPLEEEGADGDERQHEVTISRAFYLGKTEVTQGQYEQVMGSQPSHFQPAVIGNSDTSTHPVESVSWAEAVEFCERLSALPAEKAAGRVYRLPTEAEWEYACRAGTQTAFSFGDNADKLDDHAWWGGNSEESTHPVGGKKPNAWGLHDMHGNVWEWCADGYDEYPQGALSDPTGAAGDSERVFRGGAWSYRARLCRSACRGRSFDKHFSNFTLGFRVAVSSRGW